MSSTIASTVPALLAPLPADPIRPSRDRVLVPAAGILATALTAVGGGVPSFWGDEAASVLSATRPLGSLFRELGHVDAVHGVYYLFLHFWIALVGPSEAAVRFPSSVAAGLAVAGVVALALRLADRGTAVVAGAIAVVIPELTRVAVEGRSYAFTMAAAAWLTVLLVAVLRRPRPSTGLWTAYAVALGAAMYLYLYLALLIPVHLAVVLAVGRSARLRAWLASVLAAGVLAAPIALLGYAERGQIRFLAERGYANPESVLVTQWFGSPGFAVAAWSLLVVGASATIAGMRTARDAPLGVVALVWTVFPTAALLAGNAWLTPMYNMRYAGLSVPGVALLLAVGVTTVARAVRRIRPATSAAALVALLAVLAAPSYLAQRQPYAKDDGSDLRQAAATVSRLAAPGDTVVFDASVRPSRRPRLAMDLYPAQFAGLRDIELRTPHAERSALWDRVTPLEDLGSELTGVRTVWAVELAGSASPDLDVLQADGFTIAGSTTVHRTVVYELTRE